MRNQLKTVLMILFLMLGVNVMAQQKIQLNSANNSKCEKSDMTGLRATFSFSALEAQDYKSSAGEFSLLSMPNTVIGGNEGDPEIPVVNELIAVPVGATPHIKVKSYRSDDYQLDDYGIKTLVPRQPSLRKDKTPDDVPFVYNQAAYEKEGLSAEPKAVVEVVGTMRGVRLAKMTIEPVSYDPVKNTVRVFNDIEVEVQFEGALKKATDDLYTETYSPYFDIVYKQLFNGNAVKDAYSAHPDLYNTPVKMLVITTSTFANSTPFQNWVTWKKQKGIDVDVQTVAKNAPANTIKDLIYSRYNATHPTFLVLVGDETVVTYYQLWDYDSNYGLAATDLEYASVDGDIFHDMFLSRMPVSTTTELGNLVHKILTYEKYTMQDPSYLDETLLIAGWDSKWTSDVGKPTIQYANNYYFNAEHGITPHVFLTTGTGQRTCYNYINNVGFVNYTAHGDIQMFADPSFTNDNVNSLTNNDKYFWAMGNCCLTANFKNEQNNLTCFGEAMVRAANKGAFGYIGSVPESYWYEDYYFGVGATNTFGRMPTKAETKTGAYDAMFDDTGFNTLNSVPFIGNVAVTYAHANGYTSSVSDEYYWRAYQCFGDGSVMPYHKQPAANNVSHANVIFIGAPSFTVSAAAGSYVSITKDNEILGVAVVPSSGTVDVPITGITSVGDVMVVVTRQQRQPYIATIPAIAPNGPYISLDSYEPKKALIGVTTDLSLTFKNIGTDATESATSITLSSVNPNVTINGSGSLDALSHDGMATLTGFSILFTEGATLGSPVTLHYTATNGDNTWEGDFFITPNQIFEVSVASNNDDYGTVSGNGQYEYDASCTVTATPADGYMFVNWTQNGNVVSTDDTYTFHVTGNTNLVANFTEGVMIGEGTDTNEYLPSYNYYKYSLSEQIYTSAELGSAGIITSIAFYNGGAEKTRNLDFYLKATTKSSFSGKTDWIAVSSGDKVFSGNVTMVANDWTTITFSSPFVYDGTSNVVLVVDDNSGAYTSSPHMTCRVFNTTGNQALYYYDDSSNFNPLSPPTTSGSGSTNNVLSKKNQLVVSKEAIPTGSVNITASVNPAQAGTVSGGGEYQFGQTCTVAVTPVEDYMFTGWTENGVVVSTDLSFSFTAVIDRNLVANFIHATEIGQGTSTSDYLPSYNYYKYNMTEQIYTAEEMGLPGTITSIAFYNEGAEKTRTYDLYLKATSKSSFSSKTDWISVAASDKVFSGSVTMVANDWTFITFTTPFDYDGNSNVVLVVDDNTGEYTSSPNMSCSVYNTGSNQAIYIYSDNTNYNPSSPSTSQSSNNDVLKVKNHILISKEGTSDCVKPTNLTATEIGPDFIKLSWTERGVSEEWVLACGDRTVSANTNTDFVLDGLVPSTPYTIKVRPECDENLWSNAISVTTLSTCPVPTNLSVSGITHNSAVVSWTGYTESYELQYAPKKTNYYDFEDGWQGWTAIKGTEGDSPNNWMHNTDYTAYDSSHNQIVPECHNSSSGMMLSESYISANTENGSGSAVHPDNYLVSPQIQLGGSITFYAAARMSNYPAEKFSVLVSNTGNSISDFTYSELTVTLSDNNWHEYTVDLSTFSGMGYVAIRHYDCYDQHLLYIDDVTIVEGTTWTSVNPATSPCTLSGLESGTEYTVKVKSFNGDEESEWSDDSFTTFGGLVLADDASNNSAVISALINDNDVNKDVMLVGRTLYKDGDWNTICLPFDVTLANSPLKGATAKTLVNSIVNGTAISLSFGEAVTTLEAGVPYIIKWESGDNIVNPEFKNVTISAPQGQTILGADERVKFIGYYDALQLDPDNDTSDFAAEEVPNIYYMTAGNTLKHTGQPRTLKACRAYFKFSSEVMKKVQRFVLDFGGDVTTGIISIENGKLNNESGWYTVDGKKLDKQPTRKGVYIHNGVKVVVK